MRRSKGVGLGEGVLELGRWKVMNGFNGLYYQWAGYV